MMKVEGSWIHTMDLTKAKAVTVQMETNVSETTPSSSISSAHNSGETMQAKHTHSCFH